MEMSFSVAPTFGTRLLLLLLYYYYYCHYYYYNNHHKKKQKKNCLWCNGYRRCPLTQRSGVQIPVGTRNISHRVFLC